LHKINEKAVESEKQEFSLAHMQLFQISMDIRLQIYFTCHYSHPAPQRYWQPWVKQRTLQIQVD